MSAWGVTAGRAALARRALPAVVISLTAWLSLLGPAAQAALAVSGRPAPIAAGSVHSCVTESGKAYCWGYNLDGELGDGSTADSSVPVTVDTSGVLAGKVLTQISALGGHTCALDTAGAAYCWGFNLQGELGDGSTADSSVPVAVDTSGALAGKTVTQISAGGFHTCAVTATGTAYCWGSNQYGQLGNGAATDSGLPVAVAAGGALAGQAIAQVSVGDEQACAVTAAGVPSCRGDNLDGQLGDGSTVNSSVPAVVYTGGFLHRETVIQITAGGDHTCAVDAAGAAYCWGQNFYGELGDGTSHRSKKPVLVGPRAPARVHAAPGDTTATVSWTAPRRLDGAP
jgi:alpha-tubulin suppressor-like RCC1 family protein